LPTLTYRQNNSVAIGIDLAGSEARDTGFCVLNSELKCELLTTLFKDEEILAYIEGSIRFSRPLFSGQRSKGNADNGSVVIGVDAPLSLPRGRDCLKDDCKCRFNVPAGLSPHLRQCDKQLLDMHIRFFPITIGPMRKLTERGIELKNKILAKFNDDDYSNDFGGVHIPEIIEVFPGGSQDILRIPRKQKGLDALRAGLEGLGIKNMKVGKELTEHELDAVTAAYTAKAYSENNYLPLGDKSEGLIIMPKSETVLTRQVS
jgi:predicted nuclease with RNAse H fold